MRFILLCFLLILCTCGRAQMLFDGLIERGLELKGNTLLTAYARDGSLLSLGKLDRNRYLLQTHHSLTGDSASTILSVFESNNVRPELLHGTIEGGQLIVWSKKDGKDGTFVGWYESESGKPFATTELTAGKAEILGAEIVAGGSHAVLFTTKEGSFIRRLRVRRRRSGSAPTDTMSADRIIISEESKKITTDRIIDYCRLPGGSYLALSKKTRGGAYSLIRFGAGGRVSGRPIPLDRMKATPRIVRFLPGANDYLVAGTTMNGTLEVLTVKIKSGRPVFILVRKDVEPDFKLSGAAIFRGDSMLFTGSYNTFNKNSNRIPWESGVLAYPLKNSKAFAGYPHVQRYNLRLEKMHSVYGGSLLAVGFAEDQRRLLMGSLARRPTKEAVTLVYSAGRPVLHDHQGDGVLDAREQAALEVPVSGSGTYGHLRARLVFDVPPPGLKYNPTVYSGRLANGDTTSLYFSLAGREQLPSGEFAYRVLLDYEGTLVDSVAGILNTRAAPAPQINFDAGSALTYQNLEDANDFERLDTLLARIVVRNDGRDSAHGVTLSTPYIPHVYASDTVIELGSLPPGGTALATVRFTAQSYYEHDELPLNFFLHDDSGRYLHKTFRQPLPDVFAYDPVAGWTPTPKLEAYRRQRGGPSVPPTRFYKTEVRAIVPSAREDNTISTSLYHVPLRVEIVSNQEIDETEIIIMNSRTGTPVDFCFSQLVDTGGGLSVPGVFQRYEFQAELKVREEPGDNVYQVLVRNKAAGKPITVRYRRTHRNVLHIYSIGVPYGGEVKTDTAADLVAEAFRNNGGRYFDEVIIKRKNITPENTTAAAVREMIKSIQQEYQIKEVKANGTGIMPYCIIFVTGHGDITADDVIIQEQSRDRSFSVRETILTPLASVPAQKLVIVDACHSAAATRGFEQLDCKNLIRPGFAFGLITSATKESRPVLNGSGHTYFVTALLKLLTDVSNGADDDPALNDGMYTSPELGETLNKMTGQMISADNEIREIKIARKNHLPSAVFSRNQGHPSFQDYFHEVILPEKCRIRQ